MGVIRSKLCLACNFKRVIIFRDLLPQHIAEKTVGMIDVDIDDEDIVIKKSLHLISHREDEKGHQAVAQLKAEILKNGLAVYGFDETLEAARNCQIDVLLVEFH